jgi:hypothetical protein
MGFYIPVSCTPAFKERCNKRFRPGEFSKWIVELASKELDRLDGTEAVNRQKQKWIEEEVFPFLRKYAKNRNPFFLWQNQESIRQEMKEKKMEISKNDFEDCVSKLCEEYDQDGT